jgi:chemotaxis protein CheY-P-specific phosphatase CheC
MDKVTRDLLEQVKPMVTQFSNEIMKIFMDACFEAISELLTEQIDKKLETKNDTTKT